MMRSLVVALLAFCLLASTGPAGTQTSPTDVEKTRLEMMLRTGHADASWFSTGFLSQIPVTMVDDVIANVEGTLGSFQKVEYVKPKFVAYFAKGTDEVSIELDAANKIDLLLFTPPAISPS
ncbi:MAG TPA: hypothetical protein VGI19_07690 [Candidatus Cybelea sp.]